MIVVDSSLVRDGHSLVDLRRRSVLELEETRRAAAHRSAQGCGNRAGDLQLWLSPA